MCTLGKKSLQGQKASKDEGRIFLIENSLGGNMYWGKNRLVHIKLNGLKYTKFSKEERMAGAIGSKTCCPIRFT